MGRASKLTEKQWEIVGKRFLACESARALSREFEVTEGGIRKRFSAQFTQIKTVANQIVATEATLSSMSISAQISTHTLADQLRSISGHLAGAANFGAATAHRLSGIAHSKVQEIDDAAPLDEESLQALKGVAVLNRMANEASEIGISLLRANKDAVDDINRAQQKRPQLGLDHFYGANQ